MGFLGTITPAEAQAGRVLGMITAAVLFGVPLVLPLRPYARRIQVVFAVSYVLCVLGFIVYCALFR